ncbi:hypothetical protein cyc_03826 [Cyclospora cayetanensis]|uniref:Uncharacterized protein n=1 Tax=Cyclospora cayetanensis TaxID=88456 RepID=A0A1D3CS21_9EIME|nr:hypothetical protein cyc_03826 [Cyclospora cayetanensis]
MPSRKRPWVYAGLCAFHLTRFNDWIYEPAGSLETTELSGIPTSASYAVRRVTTQVHIGPPEAFGLTRSSMAYLFAKIGTLTDNFEVPEAAEISKFYVGHWHLRHQTRQQQDRPWQGEFHYRFSFFCVCGVLLVSYHENLCPYARQAGGGESTGAVVASRALPTLVFAAGWNPESFLDEKADANAAQSRSSTAATLRQNQDLIGPGSAALLHASHEEPRYSGLLASFDEDMEDLIPSAEAGELPVQHWLHEEQKLSLEVGLGKGEDQYVHELPPSDLSGLQVEKTEPKGETAAGAISIFQWGSEVPADKIPFLETFGRSLELDKEETGESLAAFQLFPSFFLLNKQRQAALPDQRNRLPLPAQSAFIVYTLLTHLYKVYNQVPRPVQRAVASVAAFLNGKEMLLIPAAVVPMELYIHLAGDALPGLSEARGEAEEAEPRTSASDPTSAKAKKQRELAALLQSFSLRVLDSENPQSPLTAVDRMVLHELASRLLDDLADPLDAREGSWLNVAKRSAEKMHGFRMPTPDYIPPVRLIAEARQMSETVKHLTQQNGQGMVKAFSEIKGIASIQNKEAEVTKPHVEPPPSTRHPAASNHQEKPSESKPLTLGGAARVDAAVATLKPTLENGKKSVQGGTALSKGPSTADDEREEAMEEQEESLQAQVAPRPSTHDGHQASNATEEQKKPLSLGGAMKIAAAVAAFKRRRTTRKGDEAKIKEQGKAVHQTEEEKEEQMTIESRSGQETAHKRHFDEIDETAVEAQEVGQEGKGAHKKLSFRAAATVAAAAAALKRRLKTKNGTPQGQAEKGTNKETINETDETHGDINKTSLLLANLQQFAAEFESLPPGNSRSSVLKKSAAVLRETEMRERGAAWTDSYHLLLDRIAQTTGNEEFSKSLKDQPEGLKKQELKAHAISHLQECVTKGIRKFEDSKKNHPAIHPTAKGEVHKYGTWCLAIADFSDASICLMQRGFMELLFHDREGILSIPSSALSVSSFVTLLASSAAASSFVHMPLASRDTADTDARPHARSSSVHMHEDSNASTQNDHTQPKTLNEGEAAVGTTREAAEAKKQSSQRNKAATKTKKRKKKKKKQDKEGGNHEAQLSKQIEYALRQQVSLDEVHSYAYLVGGYYLSSAAASLPPPEREKQLDSLTSSFTALEKATSKEDKEKKAGVLAKLAVAAAVVPPHQYIWVLYAGIRNALRSAVGVSSAVSFLSLRAPSFFSAVAPSHGSLTARAQFLCISPRKLHEMCEAAVKDPAFAHKQAEVRQELEKAAKDAKRVSKESRRACKASHPSLQIIRTAMTQAIAVESLSGQQSSDAVLTPAIEQIETSLSSRLSRQALEQMHPDTADLLLHFLELKKYTRIYQKTKQMYLSKVHREIAQRAAETKTLKPILNYLKRHVAPGLHLEFVKALESSFQKDRTQSTQTTNTPVPELAVSLTLANISAASPACLTADYLLFLSLAPFLMQLLKSTKAFEAQESKTETRGAGETDTLEKYFPKNSPFKEWLTDGHGAFVVWHYGGKKMVKMVKKYLKNLQQSQAIVSTSGGEQEAAGKKTKRRKKQRPHAQNTLDMIYLEALIADPAILPFELKKHCSAEDFFSVYTRNDEEIKHAIATAATPGAAQEALERTTSYLRTARSCYKKGQNMLMQLQPFLGDAPAADVLLLEAEKRKTDFNSQMFLWRIVKEGQRHMKVGVPHKLSAKLYRLSMSHLSAKKDEQKEALVNAAVKACNQSNTSPIEVKDFFGGNIEFYDKVVHSYEHPGEPSKYHKSYFETLVDVVLEQVDPFDATKATIDLEKQLKRAHLKLTNSGKRHLTSLKKMSKGWNSQKWKEEALKTPGIKAVTSAQKYVYSTMPVN